MAGTAASCVGECTAGVPRGDGEEPARTIGCALDVEEVARGDDSAPRGAAPTGACVTVVATTCGTQGAEPERRCGCLAGSPAPPRASAATGAANGTCRRGLNCTVVRPVEAGLDPHAVCCRPCACAPDGCPKACQGCCCCCCCSGCAWFRRGGEFGAANNGDFGCPCLGDWSCGPAGCSWGDLTCIDAGDSRPDSPGEDCSVGELLAAATGTVARGLWPGGRWPEPCPALAQASCAAGHACREPMDAEPGLSCRRAATVGGTSTDRPGGDDVCAGRAAAAPAAASEAAAAAELGLVEAASAEPAAAAA